jgi:L-2-amino-thiazoline-4-carboxylic acid hydrolase
MSELLDRMEPFAEEMRREVLEDLGRRISPIVEQPWDALRQRIHRLDPVLQEASAWRVKDPQGAVCLKVSCTLLAIYRTLSPLFEDKQELLAIMKAVIDAIHFKGGTDAFLREHFGICPDAPDDAWDQICTNFISKGQERFGSGWVVEQGIKDQRRCFFNFTKCGFADFFLAHDAREVLYLLCATDYIWGDALAKYGIRFERPTTLSEGADACRFQLFSVAE